LHTGQGKTLVGLLALQSKLNEVKKPVIYLCPNIYLAEQTCVQARQFGIKYCKLESENQIPQDFWDAKSVFITHAQILFNGFSKFGLNNRSVEIGTILLDDSHACIDVIQDAFTIKLSRSKFDKLYDKLFELFESDLELQGAAKLEEIKGGDFESFLPVPYWAWYAKQNEIIKILTEHKAIKPIKFTWELVKDIISECQCLISGTSVEIQPYYNPIDVFGSFFNADSRIFMSATTNNDSFFIKGLGVDADTILNPLTYKNEKWSGEKMILIPYLMNDELSRNLIVNEFAKPNKNRKYGIVALTPSSRSSDLWMECGAKVPNEEESIDNLLNSLKAGKYEDTVAIANRYDGVDLPDNACRILIIDSKPFGQSLSDRNQENCRVSSQILQIKIAQKIEQGLGRGVRGEKDYCVIIITSPNLINNVRGRQLKKYFSNQTNKQIEIGFEVAKLAIEQAKSSSGIDTLNELITQSLNRDESWKFFYKERMDEIEEVGDRISDQEVITTLTAEKKAEEKYRHGDVSSAVNILQGIVDSLSANNKSERGWYLQEMARLSYKNSKTESNRLQIAAHTSNRYLLKPKDGMQVKKLLINKSRVEGIKEWLMELGDFEQVKIRVEEILSDLDFGIKYEKFEQALFDLGKALGFESERPDKEWKEGPDNLWNIQSNEYILFECKNEMDQKRAELDKSETGQMNNSCAWFNNNYNGAKVINIMVAPTKNIASRAGFNGDVKIMRKSSLNKLVKNVRAFFGEFKAYDLNSVTDSQLTDLLNQNLLSIDDIVQEYCEEPYQKK
jgi:replicative superfamily II helicase